jgi:predicted 3-demethylubiquinone-9 3-methyltransferase (glyoxalase superfamily)
MFSQKITPFLWFDGEAEEAAELYTSLFPNSEITSITRYGSEAEQIIGRPAGTAMTVSFNLNGQSFTALNGGPKFWFSEAISLHISCKDQEEIDHYWYGLTKDGGEEGMCGWCKDRFGLSWQVVPEILPKLLSDPESAGRVTQAFMGMKKLVVSQLVNN